MNLWRNVIGNCENIKTRLSSSNSCLQCWRATSLVRFRGITPLWRTKTNAFILAVRGFPNLFLTVVYGVVYINVGVDISLSEHRFLYFIELNILLITLYYWLFISGSKNMYISMYFIVASLAVTLDMPLNCNSPFVSADSEMFVKPVCICPKQ